MAIEMCFPLNVSEANINNFSVGRPFLQPLIDPVPGINPLEYSKGLELKFIEFVPGTAPNVYSFFDGIMNTAVENGIRSLILTVDPKVQFQKSIFGGWKSLGEPFPKTIIYENIEESSLQGILTDLINNSYINNIINHPILKGKIKKGQEYKTIGDLASEGFVQVTAVVQDFMMGKFPLKIRSGDVIGKMGDSSAYVPVPLPFEKTITIIMKEYADNALNLLFYLQKLSNHAGVLVTNNSTFANIPGLNLISPVYKPRTELGINNQIKVFFPLGNLENWSGAEFSKGKSRIQWRIDSNAGSSFMQYQTQLRPGESSIFNGNPLNFSASHNPQIPDSNWVSLENSTFIDSGFNPGKVTAIWILADGGNTLGDYINEISAQLQFPCEYTLSIMCKESPPLTQMGSRWVRFEEINSGIGSYLADYQAIRNALPDDRAEVPQGNYDNLKVVPSVNMTWGDIKTMLNNYPKSKVKISPGIAQTLVSNAEFSISNHLEAVYPNYATLFNIPSITGMSAGDILDWLLSPKHSILACITALKFEGYLRFVNTKRGFVSGKDIFTGLDLIKLGAKYNGDLNKDLSNPWGMVHSPTYLRSIGRYYNLIRNTPAILDNMSVIIKK